MHKCLRVIAGLVVAVAVVLSPIAQTPIHEDPIAPYVEPVAYVAPENPLVKVMLSFDPSLDRGVAKTYAELIDGSAKTYNLDRMWLVAMMWQESSFDPSVVSEAGAVGLLQVMPQTAEAYGVTREALFDPKVNIPTGARYLAYLRDNFQGNIYDATVAYNQGMGNVSRGTFRDDYYWAILHHYEALRSEIK